ncbi:hypothetical protein ACFSWE_11090 [Leucobacter albus]|uniref:DUF4190 domain-containing protein n=1 Tax=Leucobacter albus TaxID=272210 RepID=A0ABW3TQN1_9MICO
MSDNTPNTDPAATPEQPQATPDTPVAPGAAPQAPAFPSAPEPSQPAMPSAPGEPYVAPAADYPGAPAAPAFPAAQGFGAAPAAPSYPGAPAAPAYPGAPAYGQAPAYNMAAPPKPKGLALTAMILGIAALVLFFIPFLSPLLGLVALVLGIMALIKKQSLGFGLTGLITGALGLIIGGIITIGVIVAFSMGGDLVSQSMDAAEACQNGATSVEVLGETISCDTLLRGSTN